MGEANDCSKRNIFQLSHQKLNRLHRVKKKMWIADKALSVVNAEKDATDISYIVAKNINDNNCF